MLSIFSLFFFHAWVPQKNEKSQRSSDLHSPAIQTATKMRCFLTHTSHSHHAQQPRGAPNGSTTKHDTMIFISFFSFLVFDGIELHSNSNTTVVPVPLFVRYSYYHTTAVAFFSRPAGHGSSYSIVPPPNPPAHVFGFNRP